MYVTYVLNPNPSNNPCLLLQVAPSGWPAPGPGTWRPYWRAGWPCCAGGGTGGAGPCSLSRPPAPPPGRGAGRSTGRFWNTSHRCPGKGVAYSHAFLPSYSVRPPTKSEPPQPPHRVVLVFTGLALRLIQICKKVWTHWQCLWKWNSRSDKVYTKFHNIFVENCLLSQLCAFG